MPQTLAELLQHAEHMVNNNKQAMVVRSVLKMKARAEVGLPEGASDPIQGGPC